MAEMTDRECAGIILENAVPLAVAWETDVLDYGEILLREHVARATAARDAEIIRLNQQVALLRAQLDARETHPLDWLDGGDVPPGVRS